MEREMKNLNTSKQKGHVSRQRSSHSLADPFCPINPNCIFPKLGRILLETDI
jgi:hypothetical protein